MFSIIWLEWFDKICDQISYKWKEKVLQIVLIIILEKLELTHIILYILKKMTFQNVIILIKSVVNKNKNNYYYNIFSEKSL